MSGLSPAPSLLLRLLALLIVLVALLAPLRRGAAGESGLSIPRWVSIRAGEVNLRTGPGTSYPVSWVYHRRRMPVEVLGEFESWRKIRDWEGTIGWVHQSMLDGRRTALVTGGERTLRHEPSESAPVVAKLQEGVIGRLVACAADWCEIQAGDYDGWLKRGQFWGVYPDEVWR
jgi:SH3-like domain-containing protein